MTTDTLVRTQSCYAAICDEASPANRRGFMDSELEAGKSAAKLAGKDEFLGLFIFNDQLMRSADRGELLSWTLLLDGVFRAVARVDLQLPTSSRSSPENLGSSVLAANLVCPTGRLIITCLSKLGEPQPPFLVLEPGIYRVSLERNETEEFEHAFLESVAEYPVGQGPDWCFHVQRVAAYERGV